MTWNELRKMTYKVLSRRDINVKKNYKKIRKVIDVTHPSYHHKFYQTWDESIAYNGHEIPVRWYRIEDTNLPILIYFHGGGWTTGSLDSYDRVCANLARITNHHVVSVDYRLAPEYKFPTAPEDCYHAAKHFFEHAEEKYGVKQDQITLVGDSAGANLAAVVSLMARDRGEFQVKQQVLVYPAVYHDFSEDSIYPSMKENGTDYGLTSKRMRDYMELYLESEEDRYHPYFAPILCEDLSRQPDTLIITAEYDPLRDEGEAYGASLKKAGNRVWVHRAAHMMHGFFALSIRRKAVADSYELINEFLEKVETK